MIDAPGTTESDWRAWSGLDSLPLADLTGCTSAVVVAAHPDDEVLGVGGAIALLAAAGTRLRLVAVTDGEYSHAGAVDKTALARRRVAETAAALRVLGAQDAEVIRLRLPDTGVARHEEELTGLLRELTCGFSICLAPWPHDAHADHEAAGRAARRACPESLSYPVWMWHWALPGDPRVPWHRGLRVPLPPAVVAAKRAAIRCFASQFEPRRPSGQPVLLPCVVAHFSRSQEVLFG
ncbi:MAG TPA: PIG-L family deacetylase [Streptosporangiaceae bacterium]